VPSGVALLIVAVWPRACNRSRFHSRGEAVVSKLRASARRSSRDDQSPNSIAL